VIYEWMVLPVGQIIATFSFIKEKCPDTAHEVK
jgi:hypothetical protein